MSMTRKTIVSSLGAVLAAALLAAAPAKAPKSGAGFTFSDWQVSTAQFDYNWQSGAFDAPSHITLTRIGSQIQADKASGNEKTKQAVLSGHVVLHDTNGVLTNFAGGPGKGPHKPATLTCDTLQIDGATKTYTAIGHVHFTQGTSSATADRAVMNGLTHDLHLYDHVHLIQ